MYNSLGIVCSALPVATYQSQTKTYPASGQLQRAASTKRPSHHSQVASQHAYSLSQVMVTVQADRQIPSHHCLTTALRSAYTRLLALACTYIHTPAQCLLTLWSTVVQRSNDNKSYATPTCAGGQRLQDVSHFDEIPDSQPLSMRANMPTIPRK